MVYKYTQSTRFDIMKTLRKLGIHPPLYYIQTSHIAHFTKPIQPRACKNRRHFQGRRALAPHNHQGSEGHQADKRRRRGPEKHAPRVHVLER